MTSNLNCLNGYIGALAAMLIGLAFYVFMRREPPYEMISILNILPDCLLGVRSYLLNVESKAFHIIVGSAPDYLWLFIYISQHGKKVYAIRFYGQ